MRAKCSHVEEPRLLPILRSTHRQKKEQREYKCDRKMKPSLSTIFIMDDRNGTRQEKDKKNIISQQQQTNLSTTITRMKEEEPTATEIQWALDIKQAAMADPAIDAEAVSDWEFLQHAIVAKHQVEKALERLHNLQAFQQKYGIRAASTMIDDAVRDLRVFTKTHPGFFLSLGEHNGSSSAAAAAFKPQILCYAYKKFNANVMKNSPEAMAIYLRAAYYVTEASQHSLAALRSGLVVLVDCQGMSIAKNYSARSEIEARQLSIHAYPVRMHECALLQTFRLMRILYGLTKPFLPRKLVAALDMPANAMEYLAQWDAHALPAAWGGTCPDFMETVVQRLKQRQERMATFRLGRPDDEE